MSSTRWITLLAGWATVAATSLLHAQGLSTDSDAPPRKLALLVGVKDYNHAELPNLRYPENDVEDLANVLRKHKFQVIMLTTAAGKTDPTLIPTCGNIQRALKGLLASVTKRDLIVVGLAGHGIQPLGSDHSYFCPLDGNPTTKPGPDKNSANVAAAPESLLSIDDLLENLQNSGVGQKLLLVDACRNDPKVRGRRGVEQVRVQSLPTETGVLLSCSAGQYAFEHQSWGKRGNGAFFSQVIAGIDGAAADDTGLITYEGLAIYVRKRVPALVKQVYGKDGGEQRPNEIKNFSGDLVSLAMVSPKNPVNLNPGQSLKPGQSTTPQKLPPDFTPSTSPVQASMVGLAAGDERNDNLLKMKFVWCPPGRFHFGEGETGVTASSNSLAQLKSQVDRALNDYRNAQNRYQLKQMSKPDFERVTAAYLSTKKRYDLAKATLPTSSAPLTMTAQQRSVNAFWMGKYEVTQRDWQRLMLTKPWQGKSDVRDEPDAPATYIDWNDAVEFCKKLTESEQKVRRLPSDWKYSLPTETHWEYACRAGTSTPFGFGVQAANLDNFGWFKNNTRAIGQGFPHPVGRKSKNGWGLHDMHGNVAEWCADLYVIPGVPAPTTAGDLQRIVRGGSWDSLPNDCRSAVRKRGPARQEGSFVGFRVALLPVSDAPRP